MGLNLTRAALDAATKYPWPRGAHPSDPDSPKFGVYEDDRPVFDWVREGAPGHRVCFEAQVMDWADDVAYSVHDLEDGLHAGHLDPNALHAEPERAEVFAVAAARYAPADAGPARAGRRPRPPARPGVVAARLRRHGRRTGPLKDATSQLIGRFCLAAEGATRARYGSGRLTRYGAELVVPREARLECAVLKAVADRYVMQRPQQEALRADHAGGRRRTGGGADRPRPGRP